MPLGRAQLFLVLRYGGHVLHGALLKNKTNKNTVQKSEDLRVKNIWYFRATLNVSRGHAVKLTNWTVLERGWSLETLVFFWFRSSILFPHAGRNFPLLTVRDRAAKLYHLVTGLLERLTPSREVQTWNFYNLQCWSPIIALSLWEKLYI